ncbi:anaerobic ribonucleoside-triphosphate reductase activating protein [Campylobacterota bacterium]|nr:anaerobic ribonucleoside-triphosphate reductase activating protein [Campylobacterota bacterium]
MSSIPFREPCADWLETPIALAKNGFVGDSIVDGPGLRCTIFAQGCPHKCKGCHNEIAWSFENGVATTPRELLARVKRHPLSRAVTFSGGEPFCQPAPFLALAKALKQEGYEVCAYTGYDFEQIEQMGGVWAALLGFLDTVIDGQFMILERSAEFLFKGSANQRIIDVQKSLAAGSVIVRTEKRWVG